MRPQSVTSKNQTTSERLVLTGIGDLISFKPLAIAMRKELDPVRRRSRLGSLSDIDLGRMGSMKAHCPAINGKSPHEVSGERNEAWLAISAGKIVDLGEGDVPSVFTAWPRHDLEGALLMPGFVDSHTHPIFAGDRSHETVQRLGGATYQEIAAKGGGISYTMKATRAATDGELVSSTKERLARFLTHGVTTVEAKSGYGLSTKDELRLLKLLKEVGDQASQTLVSTCLALHAKSPEHADFATYAKAAAHELIPEVAKQGLSRYVDAFIEDGYFSVQDCEPYIEAARRHGLKVRLHADEFSDAGAAIAAARWGAVSADHLQFASDEGIAAMAKAGTIACLLPGTSLCTKIPFTQAARFRQAGVAMAIGSDFNPGSCVLDNLPMIAGFAGVHCGLRPTEMLAAITIVAAASLELEQHKACIASGYDADLVIYRGMSFEQWVADFGRKKPTEVWISGQRMV